MPDFCHILLYMAAFAAFIYLSSRIYSWRVSIFGYLPVLAYCLSFAFIATIIAVTFAISMGTLDKNGNPTTDIGSLVLWLIHGMSDIQGELYLLVCFLCLVFGPQIMSYAICSAFGCAGHMHFLSIATRIAVWSFIKTLAAGSGIILGSLVAVYSHSHILPDDWLTYIGVSLSYIYISLATLGAYLATFEVTGPIAALLAPFVRRVHAWSTRNQRDEVGNP